MINFTCPVCNSLNIEIFIEICQIPVYCNLLYETREEALDAPVADMKLGFCKKCGHIYNYAFDPDSMDYAQNYENALHFSVRFKKYAEELAYRLVKKYNLYDKDIIEIGCGDGYFLKLLCEIGNNRGVGFDPSCSAEKFIENFGSSITFINDFYSSRYNSYQADFIGCRHVLEHIQFAGDFLQSLRDAIGNRLDMVLFFEVPNGFYTLKEFGIWDLIYEHCNYFTPPSLTALFLLHGFEIMELRDDFESQFLSVEARRVNHEMDIKMDSSAEVDRISDDVKPFAGNYFKTLNDWQTKMDLLKKRGQRTVIWGAGSKGITFLNSMMIKNQIEYVVDINPRKKGKFVAGTGQEIISPNRLIEYKPDKVVIMNPIYTEEIRKILKELHMAPELIEV